MTRRKLTVISGDLAGRRKPKSSPAQSRLANRWREPGAAIPRVKAKGDVIPLLHGWIRRLERQVGLDHAANET